MKSRASYWLAVVLLAIATGAGEAAAQLETVHAATNTVQGLSMPEAKDLPSRPAMPDPLVLDSGEKVVNAGQWKERREQMKRILEHYLTGTMPPPPGNVTGHELASRTVLNGTVNFRRVRLTFGPGNSLGFEVAVFVPTAGDKPFPTFIQPSFHPTPGSQSSNAPPAAGAAMPPSNAAPANAAGPFTNHSPTQTAPGRSANMADPDTAAKDYAELFRRGYAIVTYNYQQCGADKADCRGTGFFPAYPDYDWGDLAAWAWGMSRVVDYLQTQPFADKTRLIAVGHSRLGKATLIAGAFDERFAMVAPVGSGCAGTGSFRFNSDLRGGKQGLENFTRRFPQQVCSRLAQFSGQVDKLPFDQHWLIALVAPRPLFSAEALADTVCNGNAVKQSFLAAKPVYELLGAPANLGVHFRPGGHAFTEDDWDAILAFADQRLRGLAVPGSFDRFPPPEQLH
ncbi:MAG: hypothetical protein ABSA69_05615 [Verrucomicrobiota bacterium]|jgi:hypothetical protein